jgi:hypothetical protein
MLIMRRIILRGISFKRKANQSNRKMVDETIKNTYVKVLVEYRD